MPDRAAIQLGNAARIFVATEVNSATGDDTSDAEPAPDVDSVEWRYPSSVDAGSSNVAFAGIKAGRSLWSGPGAAAGDVVWAFLGPESPDWSGPGT
jgi:hypothetical protein